MRKIISILFFFPILFWSGAETLAQQRVVQYDRNFVFRDGIYISFSDFKNNAPIPVSRIISDYNKNSQDFFSKVLSKRTFTYVDNTGKEQTTNSDETWGYSSGGIIYVNHGTDFNRMTIIGNISHFLATVKMRMVNPDPFYYDRNFGVPQQYTYVSTQCILDFETGSIMDFSVNNMEIILSRDEALYQQFLALKKRQQRDAIFLYLRKYNEKHPIYFPE